MAIIQNGIQLLNNAKLALQNNMFFLPFKEEIISAVSLCKPFSDLDDLLSEVAAGYLNFSIFQEICINVMDDPVKANKFFETYQDKHLVITKADSLEEKIFNFSRVYYVIDVTILKLLMASQKWDQLIDFCRQNRNHFLVFGTIVNDKYIYHKDIPEMDILTLVPQFLTDTGGSPEIEIGKQLPKKKKHGTKK